MFQSDFTLEEFKARRERLCELVGDTGAVILLQGQRDPIGSSEFRQYNDFYYLCGVEEPHAYLSIEVGSGRTTLYLQHEAQITPQEEGEFFCAENPEFVKTTCGVDNVLGVEKLAACLQRATSVYTPFEAGQGKGVSDDNAQALTRNTLADPWDGRLNRPAHLVKLLKDRLPGVAVENLSPLIMDMRCIKSPKEIELMGRAGELTAVGVCEAMRSTRSGVMEYQLDAVMRYHFLAGGARDRAYIAICSSGKNIPFPHYCKNHNELTDWVLCDCAPDYHYYASDIGRMWPINGTYSKEQRSIYGYVVEYHKTLLDEIKPGRMWHEVHRLAAERMKPVFDEWEFTLPEYRAAAEALFEWRGHISHAVGMAVHDGNHHRQDRPLEVGMVFSIDPTIESKKDKLYVRIEDTVVVTADGCENFTEAAPIELDDVEKMMKEDGLVQAFPPV